MLNEKEKKAIKILQEEHDIMVNPKLEAKYTSDEVIEALYNVIMLVRRQQKEKEKNQVLIDDIKEHRIVYIDTPEFEEKFIAKDKIRELLETERIKALDRYDNKLDVTKRIYKRNIQVALIDKLKKELLEEK